MYATAYYTVPERPGRPLARPQPHRRDTKASFAHKLDGGDFGSSRLHLSVKASIPETDPAPSTRRRPTPSVTTSQLFPVDTSEVHVVNSMWAKQGRSKRGLELITSDLVGFEKQPEVIASPESTTSLASMSAAATCTFVSMTPSTSTSTSCSSLPSALFSSFAPSSTSSTSTVTAVCRSSPRPGLSKCVKDCCAHQEHPRIGKSSVSQSSCELPSRLRPLSLSPAQPRFPVSSSDSPLHVLLDQAKKDGICSAELAVRENRPKARSKVNTGIRPRSQSLSRVENDLGRRIASASSSSHSLVEDFVSSLTNKLPLSSCFQKNDGDGDGDGDGGSDIFPLLPLHPRPKTYVRRFAPLLPQPRSPFRSRSPPRHPTPRFRLIENREYLRLKAVWNRLSDVHMDDDDVDGGGYEDADSTLGVTLCELDCGCEDEGRCRRKHGWTTYLRGHPLPLPSPALIDKQGNLYTGCELVVGIAIDGIKGSALAHHNIIIGKGKKNKPTKADSSIMTDLLDGLSLANLLSSSSSKISSLSYSLGRTLESFRHLGEIHATSVGRVNLGSGAYREDGQTDTPTSARAHAAVIHSNRPISVSGPEGL